MEAGPALIINSLEKNPFLRQKSFMVNSQHAIHFRLQRTYARCGHSNGVLKIIHSPNKKVPALVRKEKNFMENYFYSWQIIR